MHRSLGRAALAVALGLLLSSGSFLPRVPASFSAGVQGALAADASISTCDWATFSAAVDAVQSSGGGTITFDCSGTITFTSFKTITSDVTIIGNGSVIFDGNDSTRFFHVNSGQSLTLIGLTLQNGQQGTPGDADSPQLLGGAIRVSGTLTVYASTFLDNTARSGGAIGSFDSTSSITVIASTFSGNTALFGGAIATSGSLNVTASTFSANSAPDGFGGAISNFGAATIKDSTFSGNVSAGAGFGLGGAIYHFSNVPLAISSSTFSSNSAHGGGVLFARGPAAITGSTISGNSSTNNGGGLYAESQGAISVRGSIVAHNTAAASGNNCVTLAGTITSQGSNLSNDASCPFTATGDIQNSASVNLGALADNGGPTHTMLPGAGSDAIDGADCALSSAEDQRGVTRPASNCDIGAVETTGTVPVQIFAAYNGSGPIDEGSSATIGAVAYGPAGASLDYDFDCNNDSSYETQGAGSGSSGSAACTFNDNGVFTVGVRVCDAADAGNCATDTTTVTVNNVNPSITSVTNDGPIDEGASATITVTATDPAGANDPLQYEFDCDNSGGYEVGPQVANTALCAFADNGSFTVPVRVTDGDGGSATGSTTVTVNNLDPIITEVTNDGTVDEGSPVTVTVSATDPAGASDPLTYSFDCNNDTVFETPGSGNQGSCTFFDNGGFTIGVLVTDGDGGSATSSTFASVTNVAPTVNTPVVDPSPSDEGQSVVASASFTDPGTADTHSCTVDYGDGSGAQAGTVDGLVCTGPAHIYLDDDPSGTSSDAYTVTVSVTDDDNGQDDNVTSHTVSNVAPAIDAITTDGPVAQGQPVTVTVTASDVGILDTLSYAFDCDDDGVYETAGVGNQGSCALDPGAATSIIGVQVSDDDLGVTTGTVQVSQVATYCANRYTGALGEPLANGSCPSTQITLELPGTESATICIHPYTGQLSWSPRGVCSPVHLVHLVPDDGPLAYCRNVYTNTLRYTPSGVCSPAERAGVIPG